MLSIKTFVLIMTFWGDSIVTQEFTTLDLCEKAGQLMQEIKKTPKHQPIQYICVEK